MHVFDFFVSHLGSFCFTGAILCIFANWRTVVSPNWRTFVSLTLCVAAAIFLLKEKAMCCGGNSFRRTT